MPRNEIVARLRLKSVTRFQADAKRAEHSIDEIGDAADRAGGPLNNLGGFFGELADKFPDLTGRTRIFGFAVGTVVTALVAAIPLVVGLGGALTAVAGSFGAAALGAGALGVAVAGAAIPLGAFSLVAMGALQGFTKVNTAFEAWNRNVKMYGRNSTEAETALNRLNAVTEMFGGSVILQAVQSWDRFMKSFRSATRGTLRDIYGMMLDLIEAGQELLPIFADVTKVVSTSLRGGLKTVIDELTSPEFIGLFRSLGDIFARISGPLLRSATNMLFGFLQIAVRLEPAVVRFVSGIERASMAFRDWATNGDVSTIVRHLESWWGLLKAVGGLMFTIFSSGASDGKSLVDSLTGVINKWNEWLQTAEGQTSIRNFFRDAIAMTKAFFRMFSGVISGIFKFGKWLLPVYEKVFGALVGGWRDVMDALEPAEPFFRNVLGPILKGLAKGVIAGVVGAFKFLTGVLKIFARILGVVGDFLAPLKPLFEVIGNILGFIFGGAILKVLGMMGRLSIVLKPLGGLFRLLAVPINLAGKVVMWFGGKIADLAKWIFTKAYGLFRPFTNAADDVLDWFMGAGEKFFNAGVWIWNRLKAGVAKVVGAGLGLIDTFFEPIKKGIEWIVDKIEDAIGYAQKLLDLIPNPGGGISDFMSDFANKVGSGALGVANSMLSPFAGLPGAASGGVFSGNGSWITGESGPEVNTLRNGQVTVVPLTPSVAAQSTNATMYPGDGKRTIVTKIHLRGRQIAEAVAEEIDDERARR